MTLVVWARSMVVITVLLGLFEHHLVHALAHNHLLLQLLRHQRLFLHLVVDLQGVQNAVALSWFLCKLSFIWNVRGSELLFRLAGYWCEMADRLV